MYDFLLIDIIISKKEKERATHEDEKKEETPWRERKRNKERGREGVREREIERGEEKGRE